MPCWIPFGGPKFSYSGFFQGVASKRRNGGMYVVLPILGPSSARDAVDP